MPRLAIDYFKTVIYKIVHQDDYENANVYVGHTTDFIKRKNSHKSTCSNPNTRGYNCKKNQYIRQNGGWDCFKMVELEKYPCKDEREASAREEYWRDNFKANLNAKRCFRTEEQRAEQNREKCKEWCENNKEKLAEQKKEYYEDNKAKIAEKAKEYRKDNKDKLAEMKKEYYENNKVKLAEQKKEYYEDNKAKIAEKAKEYYENNKHELLEKMKEKVKCEYCNSQVRKSDLQRHQRTQKCQAHQK